MLWSFFLHLVGRGFDLCAVSSDVDMMLTSANVMVAEAKSLALSTARPPPLPTSEAALLRAESPSSKKTETVTLRKLIEAGALTVAEADAIAGGRNIRDSGGGSSSGDGLGGGGGNSSGSGGIADIGGGTSSSYDHGEDHASPLEQPEDSSNWLSAYEQFVARNHVSDDYPAPSAVTPTGAATCAHVTLSQTAPAPDANSDDFSWSRGSSGGSNGDVGGSANWDVGGSANAAVEGTSGSYDVDASGDEYSGQGLNMSALDGKFDGNLQEVRDDVFSPAPAFVRPLPRSFPTVAAPLCSTTPVLQGARTPPPKLPNRGRDGCWLPKCLLFLAGRVD
jgi:hypothetical protein